jgi:hypothetical protein
MIAIDRNQSIWQAESAETKTSSGSTAAGSDRGTGTTTGDDDPGNETPPSNSIVCRRLYFPSTKTCESRFHTTFAVYRCMAERIL